MAFTIQTAAGLITVPVDSATAVAVGDLLYLNTDDARPASMLANGGSLAVNQAGFHDYFLGIAQTAKAAGAAGTVLVATSGRISVPCVSETHVVGDLMAASAPVGFWPLSDTTMRKVLATNQALGRCAQSTGASTTVIVDVVSTVMYGGPMPA